jgi:uncharacterized membrane protein YcgQ (UPF0703/DUF1980 family)
MSENKSARNSLIIAVVILAVTASFLMVSYVKTKRKLEHFNVVLEKDETLNFPQVMQTLLDDKKYGTTEENIRYESKAPNKGVVEIKEKMFIAQINDVYLNSEDYLGKTIKLEGIFMQDEGYDKTYSFVIRYGPGCCGTDGNAGFEVAWAKDQSKPYPAVDSWVEAIGVLKTYEEEDGYMPYLYLDLSSLNVLNKRGAEFVLQ